ncbi:MAG: ABC transporter ATP-binding protein [Acidimicrobiia bacterium]|nr:ABC transporter ATP-binding protein [Acidimicrobiia bacterium]MCY4457943.1 ABC transporter ATP-binding protein [Acidimicrobiaceae bacterium]
MSVDPHSPTILDVRNTEIVYNDVILVLSGVSLRVNQGDIVTLLGANGAGKTTLLRAITGLLEVHRGRMTKGSIAVNNKRVDHADPAKLVRAGVSQVMEGRRIFAELTVEENLRTGAHTVRHNQAIASAHERVMELFPQLKPRRNDTAGYLSGGEQQMLAIGRALMATPKLLLLDEPSLGLAPKLVEQISEIVRTVNQQGTSVLLVEQNAHMALSVSNRAYVLENGRIVKEGAAADLLEDDDVREFYLGVGEAGRKSFRDVKSYRRRKRWNS